MLTMHHPDRDFDVEVPEWAVDAKKEMGWLVGPSQSAGGDAAPAATHPAGNASREMWAEYALAQGATDDDIAEFTRDDLRDRYTQES